MRSLFITAGLLSMTLLFLMLFVRMVGQTSGESRSPVTITPDCHPPCWNNIHPGDTHVDSANQLLLERNGTISHYTQPQRVLHAGTQRR